MKKIFMVIALMAMLMLPFTSFSMTAMEEGDLSSVTGQSGVSINLDAAIDLHLDVVAWGDSDGLGDGGIDTTTGWIGLKTVDAAGIRVRLSDRIQLGSDLLTTAGTRRLMVVNGWTFQPTNYTIIAGIVGATNVGAAAFLATPAVQAAIAAATNSTDPVVAANAGGLLIAASSIQPADTAEAAGLYAYLRANHLHELSIDVATGTPIGGAAGTTYVHLGLGSLEIGIGTLDAKVQLGSTTALGQQLGTIYIGGLLAEVDGLSTVDIYKHTDSGTNVVGVGIGFDINVIKVTWNDLSWGDDGLDTTVPHYDGAAYTTAGYVGLSNATMNNLALDGSLTIDVATGTPTGGVAGQTFVRIGYNNLTIGMGDFSATAALGMNKNELGHQWNQTLGQIYLQTLAVNLQNGFVDIYAPAAVGSSGVRIGFDVTMDVSLATAAWGDLDTSINPLYVNFGGALPPAISSTAVTAGWVGLTSLSINDLHAGGVLTVDVATAVTAVQQPIGTTFVRLGFNNLTVGMDTLDATVAMGTANTAMTQVLGSVSMKTLAMSVSGNVDIHSALAAGTSGVVLDLNATVSSLTLASVTWGDADGIGAGSTAGYVGLDTLAITNLVVAGPVAIDVATITPGCIDNFGIYRAVGMSNTFVRLTLGTGIASSTVSSIVYAGGVPTGAFTPGALGIKMATMSANVVLGDNKVTALATNLGTLGQIYVGNALVGVNGWVDIAAH